MHVADDKDKNEIKDLEESLFKEFNEKVRLNEPTDSRLQGSVDLNPKLDEPNNEKVDTSESDEEKKVKASQEEDLNKELKKEELNPVTEIDNSKKQELELGNVFSTFVEKVEKIDDKEELDKNKEPDLQNLSLKEKALFKIKKINEILKPYYTKLYLIIKPALLPIVFPVLWFYRIERRDKTVLIVILSGLFILSYLMYNLYYQFISPVDKSPYLVSYESVAGSIYKFPKDTNFEVFFSPAFTPDYAYEVSRIIANVRRSANSGRTPMIFMDVVLKASNQSTAIEFKDRNIELVDLIARTAERHTFDDLRSEAGKERLKRDITRSINPILNHGIVIDVLYKNFIIKP